jgi:ubiquinone/menaquinone biosynthesis C-methylase UbiE
MKFKESKLAHKYLDGLSGIEIGGSANNSFNLQNCLNVDVTGDMDSVFKKAEERLCGEKMTVDIVASGDNLPLQDESVDYVISSHVIEHFFDPIKAINEWLRVTKKGGYIFIIAPHKDRTFDKDREITKLEEIISRHGKETVSSSGKHWNVWDTEAFGQLCQYMNLNVVEYLDRDDKAGNGFCYVIQK